VSQTSRKLSGVRKIKISSVADTELNKKIISDMTIFLKLFSVSQLIDLTKLLFGMTISNTHLLPILTAHIKDGFMKNLDDVMKYLFIHKLKKFLSIQLGFKINKAGYEQLRSMTNVINLATPTHDQLKG
jgi:hypothetical protein